MIMSLEKTTKSTTFQLIIIYWLFLSIHRPLEHIYALWNTWLEIHGLEKNLIKIL